MSTAGHPAKWYLPLVISCLRTGLAADVSEYLFTLLCLHEDVARPRVPMLLHPVKRTIRDNIVRLARDVPSTPKDLEIIGRLLFNFVVPRTIRQEVRNVAADRRLEPSLRLVTNDNELPWELIHDKTEHWCLCYQMGRIYGIGEGAHEPLMHYRGLTRRADSLVQILVIADPDGSLPSARTEGQMLVDRLEGIGRVENIRVLFGSDATLNNVALALASGDYDIIHFAGHAVFEPTSALCLANGELLDEATIAGLALTHAPLVFANACDTGAERYVGGRTVGLASAFISAGASAYVGAMWQVTSAIAADLSHAFYGNLLKRQSVGDALRHAKRTVQMGHPEAADWASFALYGYPGTTVFAERPTTLVAIDMSDKAGTLAAVTGVLSRLGVNLIRSRSFAAEEGERAGYIAEVEMPQGATGADVFQMLKQELGDLVIDASELPNGLEHL